MIGNKRSQNCGCGRVSLQQNSNDADWVVTVPTMSQIGERGLATMC